MAMTSLKQLGLHGRVTLGEAIPTFPWPPADEYIERMIQIHIIAAAYEAPSTS